VNLDTAWQQKRFHERDSAGRLLFGQVYEDAAIEKDAFAPGGRVFCIASAGCTALDLAEHHEVVACDINPAQVHYVQRRLQGGPVEVGSAESLMNLARSLAPLAGWRRSRLREFLDLDDPAQQRDYWQRHLDGFVFRHGMELMLSRICLRAAYSPELLACLPTHFGRVLRERMERCFFTHSNRQNPYARALLLGETRTVRAERLAPRIELVVAEAASYLQQCAAGSFDGFSLSNILDGADPVFRQRLFAAVRHAARSGAVVVQRSFAEPAAALEHNRAADDRAFLWSVVDVRPVSALGA
jgi:S-adenosylmethionine:diacylglycerol 3-amino-3-carboxypropyl transferase